MLFINISADKVYISHNEKEYILNRNGIENEVGSLLIKLYKETPFKELRVCNGPGGFTNLRVGALCINMLNTLENKKIDIYSFTKPELYIYAYKKGLLPQKGILYIGQQKNLWLYDCKEEKYETIQKDTIPAEELFYDKVYDNEYFKDTIHMVDLKIHNKKLQLTYQKKTIEITPKDLGCKTKKEIQAEYMIQPIIGNQNQ